MSAMELEYERIDYTVKETGQEIRKALKAAFPGVKFSLRGSRGTGYGWFSLSWVDGPTTGQVREITGGFQSSYFDGMDDSNHHIPATMYADPDGVIREHRFSCKGVNGSREYTPEAIAWMDAYIDAHGGPEAFSGGYGPDYASARWKTFQDIDLTGIEWDALPMPEPGFKGRHVPDCYAVDNGRPYNYTDEEPTHRA
ncbi:hypothetical protein GCM10022234_00320 [Aeromicrobium panaciterrae]|uniref:LPD29 domain-containing protein n=1 Tax=Aeromicrobium panaciterrae TaxID=363861 RepID=UPI0031E266C9